MSTRDLDIKLPQPLLKPNDVVDMDVDIDLGEFAAERSISGDHNTTYYTSLAASRGYVCSLVSYSIILAHGRSVDKDVENASQFMESINNNFHIIEFNLNKQFQVMIQDLVLYLSEDSQELDLYLQCLEFALALFKLQFLDWKFGNTLLNDEEGLSMMVDRMLLNFIRAGNDLEQGVGMFMSAYSYLFPKQRSSNISSNLIARNSMLLILKIYHQPPSPILTMNLAKLRKLLSKINQSMSIYDEIYTKITE